ncbi:HupE/UreJ family protein [Anthocerotibacter panamensis]|uniref:HupE/UreJ family protein n=1 Tax=Anthocerotibacter panamensis TaxID=2857077 RepID=UPI001FDA6470|nr:HupE/UreJ family protein [Anthocerotibacter panamensis]
MKKFLLLLVGLCLFWGAPSALAHKPSDSYLTFDANNQQMQWDIALRDLDYALGLDSNDDGAITWGELHAHQQAVTDYALARLQAFGDGALCPLQATDFLVDGHSDGVYAVLRLRAKCAQSPAVLTMNYRLFFEVDPQHRGLLRWTGVGGQHTAIFSPEQPQQRLELKTVPSVAAQLLSFGREGVWHIWLGFDHILFLLTLLLPAVLARKENHWTGAATFPPVLKQVLQTVTAFTVAHSLTLALATLGVVQLPTRWVESVIALSVLLTALNNLFPLVREQRWVVAFGFGLVHGFGFASVLADLGLGVSSLLPALLGFNLGVEVGQLAIVAVFLPLAFTARQTWLYPRLALMGGSCLIAGIAAVWLVERVFDLKVLAF